MTIAPKRYEAFKFFREYAGWSVPPGKARCALDLARAEELLVRAEEEGIARITWELDDMPYEHGYMSREEVATMFESGRWTGPYGCILEVNGEHVASLWSIALDSRDLDDPYARVIQGELAWEAEEELRQAIGDTLDAREETLV